ncbi:hypothetical protein D9M71_722710 [compost metagenome]
MIASAVFTAPQKASQASSSCGSSSSAENDPRKNADNRARALGAAWSMASRSMPMTRPVIAM